MNKDYIVIDNFLSSSNLELLYNYVENNYSTQSIVVDDILSKQIYNDHVDKFRELAVVELSDRITISKGIIPIAKHRDNVICGETHKILIYLNEIPNGGTYFYINGKAELVENKLNRLVLFDIKLEHRGQDFSRDYIKKTIGFRPIMYS